MLTPTSPYADAFARLTALQQQAVTAYVRHARRPGVRGPEGTARAYRAAYYEARTALAEQNPAFAVTLLPRAGVLPALGAPGLPLLPAGVRYVVDDTAPGTVSVSVDVAGAVSIVYWAPGSPVAQHPVVTTGATRSTAVLDAPVDGAYRLALQVGGTVLAYLLVPVMRAEHGRFRENSRALGFAFEAALPRPKGAYIARRARLIAAEAAARTGQAQLFADMAASAAAVPVPSSPIHLYPRG